MSIIWQFNAEERMLAEFCAHSAAFAVASNCMASCSNDTIRRTAKPKHLSGIVCMAVSLANDPLGQREQCDHRDTED